MVMKRTYLSRRDHNRIFSKNRTRWFYKYEYFLGDEEVRLIEYPRLFVAVWFTLLLPVFIVLHGVVNFKDVWGEVLDMYAPKKRGSYLVYNCSSPDTIKELKGVVKYKMKDLIKAKGQELGL